MRGVPDSVLYGADAMLSVTPSVWSSSRRLLSRAVRSSRTSRAIRSAACGVFEIDSSTSEDTMLKKGFARLLGTNAPAATLLVRISVGVVFLTSGIVKFIFENQGEGRFLKLGFHAPEATAYFVGAVEIAAGSLLMVGLLTRLAAIPLVIDMTVAIVTSKLPLLFGPGPEPVAAAPKVGLWAFAYVARLDLTMLFLVSFLLVVGAGAWSTDAWLLKRSAAEPHRSIERDLPAFAGRFEA